MARIDKREITRLEIIQVVTKQFLETGYSHTTIKQVSRYKPTGTGGMIGMTARRRKAEEN